MPVAFLMDHNVRWASRRSRRTGSRPITAGLRLRGVDVLTALDDGSEELDDPALLDRAGTLGRVLYSEDTDLLAEATRRQRAAIEFVGVVYAHQSLSVRACIDDLELIAKSVEMEDLRGQVIYLRVR